MNLIARKINALLDQADASSRQILETKRQLHESELRKNQAELYALQSQVNPHFLYNTLQCVRGIAVHHGINDIANIALALSELFRYSIKGSDLVRVSDELSVVRHYLKIMEIRYSGRFSYSIDVTDEMLSCSMPKMALQSLTENAVIHGFEKTDSGGEIRIEGRSSEGAALLSVKDNGTGMEEPKLSAIRAALDDEYRASGNAPFMGLNNIHRRLRLAYGPDAGLSIEAMPGKGTTVTLHFPAERI
jgi:two-component system sensor histidine kinase YesM